MKKIKTTMNWKFIRTSWAKEVFSCFKKNTNQLWIDLSWNAKLDYNCRKFLNFLKHLWRFSIFHRFLNWLTGYSDFFLEKKTETPDVKSQDPVAKMKINNLSSYRVHKNLSGNHFFLYQENIEIIQLSFQQYLNKFLWYCQ